jgi:sRNA-binding protein
MNKSRVLAGMVATVAVAAVIAGGTVFGVNIHNEQVARQLEQQHHAQAVATMLAIEGNTVHTSGAAVDQAATVAGDAEAVQIAAQQAAAAKAAADAAAAQLAAQQQAQKVAQQAAAKKTTTTTTKATTRSTTNTTTDPAGPVKCPAGSISNGADGNGNDISCTYPVCQSIQIPDPAHPECDAPFKP